MEAVILAAGVGERMQPLTHTQPKVLLPIAGKPVLDYVFNSLKKSGIKDITLIVGYLKEDIQDRFGDGSDIELNIFYIEQPEQKGTADAISYSDCDDTFVVLNGDVYCDAPSLTDTIERHNKENAVATLGTYRVQNAASYGTIQTKNGKVKEIVEKPEKTTNQLINAGVYVFEPEIYQAIKETPLSKRKEKEITTSIELLIDQEKLVNSHELESWVHVGRPWDLLVANERALKNHTPYTKGEIEPGTNISENVIIEEGARIRSGAYIEGPAYIGKNSDIGPNCYIRPHTSIGEKVRIGNAVEVKNSIIMDGTHAAHHTYIGDSIIGQNCNFGSGTKIGNLRLDAGNIIMTLRGKLTDTGRRKLGAVLGDNVHTGINSMVNPGVKLGPNSAIGPGAVLYEDLPPNKCIQAEQVEEVREWKDA